MRPGHREILPWVGNRAAIAFINKEPRRTPASLRGVNTCWMKKSKCKNTTTGPWNFSTTCTLETSLLVSFHRLSQELTFWSPSWEAETNALSSSQVEPP